MKQFLFYLLALTSVTANAQKAQKTEEIQLKLLHYKAPCWGESIHLCYLIEKKSGEIENFYNSIEGFEYEWGYNYRLIVEKFKVAEPKADGSAFGFRLKKQVSKERVSSKLRFELPLVENGYLMVKSDDKKCMYFGVVPISTGSVSCEKLSAGKSGVFQHQDTGGLHLVEMK